MLIEGCPNVSTQPYLSSHAKCLLFSSVQTPAACINPSVLSQRIFEMLW